MKKNKTYTKPKSVFATIFRCKQRVLFSLFYFIMIGVFAQNFPVQVIPQATPPPPIYLSNYADASTVNSPLRVQIILNDLNIQSREVRLKVYFQGSGLTFESNDFVTGASTLFLEGGVPLILTNVELAPYFKFENITGISPNVYGNSIPEGTYQFCFEVFDIATGNRLSRKSCVTSVIFKNEPPFLISPRNKDNIAEINPQNIVFQWTPRSINVTNVEYELSLVEIWDTQIDPQAAFLSSPPIFQTTTTSTTYVFGPSDPLLLSGKNYAWRVQAKAKQGIEEIGLFKNQGYSEIFSFSYASACDLPLSINHEVKGSTITNIFWDDFSNEVPEYTVRYRKKGNNNEWFYNKTSSNTTSLWDLKAGTTYEYQIRKKCSVTESDWSITKQFTTHIADNEESVYECGITPNFTLSNTEPLATIENGEKFTAGDFPIHVLEVSGSNGRFTGKGYVTIPYLNSIRVGVKFTNILINTDKQMAEGTVITMYDPSLKNLLDVDEAIETVANAAEAVGELFEGNNDLDEIHVNWVLDPDKDIKVEDGILIITNPENGATETSPLGDDKVIVDKSGQTYHIDAGGAITPGGQIDPSGSVTTGNVTGVSRDGDLESLTAQGIQVTFESTGIYGYDQMPLSATSKLKKEYTTVPDASGSDYTLAHIAVENEKTITVTAKVTFNSNSDYTLADLKFKTKTGELIPVIGTNESKNTIDLNFTGHYTTESETIYAVVPQKEDNTKQATAGAFTLWHLTDRVIDVVLVSVDNAPLPNTTEIAKIFKKGVATFNFETETATLKDSDALGADETLAIADNPWLTAYNQEQKALIKHIKAQFSYDKDKYYVLVFKDDFKTTKPLAGFMPLQRQFGFVFNGGLNKGEEAKGDVTTVTAHELGHGVFALQHPFTEYGTVEGSTDLLMDYKDGAVDLNHMNWAQMHNPALKFYVFQDEEDGEYEPWKYISSSSHILPSIPENIVNSSIDGLSFISKQGVIFSLPKNAKDITFFDNGTLYGFTIEGIRYVSCTDADSNTKFKGYSEECGKVATYKDLLSQKLDFNSIIKTYYAKRVTGDCGKLTIYQADYKGSIVNGSNDGIISSNTALKTFDEVTENVLEKETTETNIFSCLKSKSLQTLYKYIEYTYKDFDHLESLFTTLNEFNCFRIDQLIDDTVACTGTKTLNETINISENNHIVNFNNQIQDFINKNQDYKEYSLNLKILFKGYNFFEKEAYTDMQECLLQWITSKDIRNENALLPDCLYKNIDYPRAVYYSGADLAYMTGMIDGGYIAGNDIATLLKAIDEFSIAYGSALIQCNLTDDEIANEIILLLTEISKIPTHIGSQALINLTDVGSLVNDLIKENPALYNAIASIQGIALSETMENFVKFSKAVKEMAPKAYQQSQKLDIWVSEFADGKVDCEKYKKVREDYIQTIKSLEQILNPTNDQFGPFIEQIKQELVDYGNLVTDDNSIARYEHGKIAFQILSEVLIAIATEGSGNVATMMTRVSTKALTISKNIPKWLVRSALRSGIRADGEFLVSSGRRLAQITDEGILLLPESVLPSNIPSSSITILDKELPPVNVKLADGTLLSEKSIDIVEYNSKKYLVVDVSGAGRFIAKSGNELRNHLATIVNKPLGKPYNGEIYRSLSKSSETNFGALPNQMTDHHIYSSWGRYDLAGEENAMYLSKTLTGNQTELVPHYGAWNDFSTYKYTSVQADNLLDLTDDVIRQQLGSEFEQLTKVLDDKAVMYEFTNELAKWARQKGYNGLIVPGARGAKDYQNVILFEQAYINQILQGKTAIPIPK